MGGEAFGVGDLEPVVVGELGVYGGGGGVGVDGEEEAGAGGFAGGVVEGGEGVAVLGGEVREVLGGGLAEEAEGLAEGAAAEGYPGAEVGGSGGVFEGAGVVEGVNVAFEVGVVVTEFAAEKVLTCAEHGDAEGHHEGRHHDVGAAAVVGGEVVAVAVGVFGNAVEPAAVVVRFAVVDGLGRPSGEVGEGA